MNKSCSPKALALDARKVLQRNHVQNFIVVKSLKNSLKNSRYAFKSRMVDTVQFLVLFCLSPGAFVQPADSTLPGKKLEHDLVAHRNNLPNRRNY